MSDDELADGLVAWARAELDEVVAGYGHPPKRHTQGLPEVAVGIVRRSVTDTMPGVGRGGQQTMFDLRSCEMVVAVTPEPAAERVGQLRDMAGRRLVALRGDRTLGGRFQVVSPLCEVDYEPGEIQADDGSEMRGFTLNLSVADVVAAF